MNKQFAVLIGITMLSIAGVVIVQTGEFGDVSLQGSLTMSSMPSATVCGGSNGTCGGTCGNPGWQCLWNANAHACVCTMPSCINGTSCGPNMIWSACSTTAPACVPLPSSSLPSSSFSSSTGVACYYCGYEDVPVCAGNTVNNCDLNGATDCEVVGSSCKGRFLDSCQQRIAVFASNTNSAVAISSFSVYDVNSEKAVGDFALAHNCTSLRFDYLGHGSPAHCAMPFNVVDQCLAIAPNCSAISSIHTGCSVFQNLSDVQSYAQFLQSTLPSGVTVTVGANQTIASGNGTATNTMLSNAGICTSYVTTSINCSGITTTPQTCRSTGDYCYLDSPGPFQCTGANGTMTQQVCCPGPNNQGQVNAQYPIGGLQFGTSCMRSSSLSSSMSSSNASLCGGTSTTCGGRCGNPAWACGWNPGARACICSDPATSPCAPNPNNGGLCGGMCGNPGWTCNWNPLASACVCTDPGTGTSSSFSSACSAGTSWCPNSVSGGGTCCAAAMICDRNHGTCSAQCDPAQSCAAHPCPTGQTCTDTPGVNPPGCHTCTAMPH